MSLFSIQAPSISKLMISENQIMEALSAQQKMVVVVAIAALSLFVAAITIYRCYHRSAKIQPVTIQTHQPSSQEITERVKKLLLEEVESEKQTALILLEKAFNEVLATDPKMEKHIQLYANLFSRYGQRLYPQFENALPYLLFSLNLQLLDLGLLENRPRFPVRTLNKIDKIPECDSLIKLIKTADKMVYPSWVEGLADDRKLQVARTLLTLGGIFSNLQENSLNIERAPFLTCLSNLYHGVEEILQSTEQTPEILEQIGEIHYHAYPGLFLDECELKNDGTVSREELDESFELLDRAAEYNTSLQMKARIANLKACRVYTYLQDLDLAKKLARESLDQWETVLKDQALTPAQLEEYGSLYANVNNNYLSILIKTGNHSHQEMETYATVSRKFYLKTKEKHPYSIILAYNLARLEKLRNDSEQALFYLNEIDNISKSYQEWPDSKTYQEKAAFLRKEIESQT